MNAQPAIQHISFFPESIMRSITNAAMSVTLLAACATPPVSPDPIAVVAAGSLREALTEVAQAHEARTGQ